MSTSRGLGALLAVTMAIGAAAPAAAQAPVPVPGLEGGRSTATLADGTEVAITDQAVRSFDGTDLDTTLFVPDGVTATDPAPLVLRTHGFGLLRARDLDGGQLERLLEEGYVVLTWDSRGFGCSGGEVRIDDPQVEGRDASALIDWAIDHAPVELDATGDPVVGMTGLSYAGGIQTATASVDPRVDALAPEISWSDLRYSLYPGEVVKQGWVTLLFALGTTTGTALGLDPRCERPTLAALDPAIPAGVAEFVTTNAVSDATLDFFAKSSLASYGRDTPVAVPTLVMQGATDTLFDLTDGLGIVEHVRDQGVEASFLAFCGGHVGCPASYGDADDAQVMEDAIVAWFARHLRGQDVAQNPSVTYRTNDAQWRTVDDFGGGAALSFAGVADGLVALPVIDLPDPQLLADAFTAGGGSLPPLPFVASTPAPDGDPRAARVEVARAADGPLELVGVPDVTLTVTGQQVPLQTLTEPLGGLLDTLPLDVVGELLIGSVGPVGSLLGGLLRGIGSDDAALGGLDDTTNVFVRLVDREAGEVIDLQEGAVRVPLDDGPVTLDVTMPGIAYTLPAGHHLDVEVSTASLVHATGRNPALLDVEVAGSVPVVTTVTPITPVTGEQPGDGGPVERPTARDLDLACPEDRVPDAGFTDNAPGGFARLAIDCIAWWGVTAGLTDTTYGPSGTVSRGQMASFIARSILDSGGSLPAAGDRFADVGEPHGDNIERLAAAGVIQGFDDGTFRPGLPVSRDQMATFLVAGFEQRAGERLPTPRRGWFDDVAEDATHATTIAQAHEAGFAAGVTVQRYAPGRAVRRDQMALFVMRVIDRHVEDARTAPPDTAS